MSKRIPSLTAAVLAASVLVLALTAATTNADTIYVCWDGSGDYLTIQEGIDVASNGDEVVVCDGTYTDIGNKNLDFAGKAITVRSENGPDNCIIDCEGDGRGFYFYSGEAETSVVEGFTITDGLASDGGGVSCDWWSSPTLTNCTIAGNTAGLGGGGLGCYYDSSPTLTNCTITGNAAEGVNGAGGGVHCLHNGNPTLSNCTIVGNTAGYGGGGVLCGDSSVILANCILWGNWAYHVGPQGYVGGSSSVLSVSYSDVEDGQAGIYVDGGTLDWGPGNIDADPLFVDPDGPDNDPDTWEDNDYHIGAGSPCIDAACNWGVPPDTGDLDDDDDTDEITPFDLDGEGRFFDDPNTDDTGCGCAPIVDMGAYEFGDTGPQPCLGDLDCDRVVGHSDLGILLSCWDCDCGDLNCDGVTDQTDLGILLAHWGEGCP